MLSTTHTLINVIHFLPFAGPATLPCQVMVMVLMSYHHALRGGGGGGGVGGS